MPPCIIVHWEGSGAGATAALSELGWDVREYDLSAPAEDLSGLRGSLGEIVLCGVSVPGKRLTLGVHKMLAAALSQGDVVVLGRPVLPRRYRVIAPDYGGAGLSLVATLCGPKRNTLVGTDALPHELLCRTRTLASRLTPREAWPSELEDFMGEPSFPRFRDTVPAERVE